MAPGPATPIAPSTLDATAGRVRLQPTQLHGAVKTVVPGTLTLQLRAIDRLGIAMFDFAGTGAATTSDADPNNYEVQTGNLSLANLAAGEAANVIGFVTPFGSAPPDFVGATVVDHRDLPSTLGIGWGAAGTTAPFVSMSATGLVIDITNKGIGDRHFILSGMQKLDNPDARVRPDDRADHGPRHVRGLGARPTSSSSSTSRTSRRSSRRGSRPGTRSRR